MNSMVSAALAAGILLAIFLAGRGVAREIAAPFQELDRMAKPRPIAVVDPDPEPEVVAEPQPDGELANATEEPVVEEMTVVRAVLPANEVTPLGEAQLAILNTWDEWWNGAIAELPEYLREDSDHRRAIDETYRSAVGELFDARQVKARLAQVRVLELETHAIEVGFTDQRAEVSYVILANPTIQFSTRNSTIQLELAEFQDVKE